MSSVSGSYRNGHVELESPVDWPEGSAVEVIHRLEASGLRESDWPDNDATRAEILRRLAAIEPFEMTAEEEREIEAALKALGAYSATSFR